MNAMPYGDTVILVMNIYSAEKLAESFRTYKAPYKDQQELLDHAATLLEDAVAEACEVEIKRIAKKYDEDEQN